MTGMKWTAKTFRFERDRPMTDQLKFEAGKHYRTRGGDKVLCVHVLKCGKPIVVNEAADTYGHRDEDGTTPHASFPTPWDIVGEWQEQLEQRIFVNRRDTTKFMVLSQYDSPAEFADPQFWRPFARVTVTEGEGLE